MIPSIQSFARAVHRAHIERIGFTATQVVASGQLNIEAEIRQLGRRSTRIEFKTYQSPWTELEETLSGQVEYTGDEWCALTIHQEGGKTWIVDPATSTATRKLGSHLYEPIPGIAAMAELSFLDRLTQDFLLRDLGEHPHGDGRIRRISLKPKQAYRLNLLSTTSFPIRSATIDFDTETLFPYSISILPSDNSPSASIVGPQARIVITYSNVQVLEDDATVEPFEPQAGAHIFEESVMSAHDLDSLLPFSLPLHVLSDHGFSGSDSSILLTLDAEKERAYLTAHFTPVHPPSEEETERARLTIACGNYMSRNMARRRVTLSEQGTQATEDAETLTVLDRSTLWHARFPGVDVKHAPVEIFFEKTGIFWFLSGTNMKLDALQALALDISNADSDAARADADESSDAA